MFDRLRYKLQNFMIGRYGADQFARFLSVVILIMIVVGLFIPGQILSLLSLLLIVYMYYRMFSRDIPKRYAENQKYLALQNKVTGFFRNFRSNVEQSKAYHIYKCPKCGQKIRIPRGKGHIMVRCPKCSFEFHKKS